MLKYFCAILVICFSLIGCTGTEVVYTDPNTMQHLEGTVPFCDDLGCREIQGRYFYDRGAVVYWDVHFGRWIGPHGYWLGRTYYHGRWNGYHTVYHRGVYQWRDSHHYYHYHYHFHYNNGKRRF